MGDDCQYLSPANSTHARDVCFVLKCDFEPDFRESFKTDVFNLFRKVRQYASTVFFLVFLLLPPIRAEKRDLST